MKLFWTIIFTLIAATGAMWYMQPSGASPSEMATTTTSMERGGQTIYESPDVMARMAKSAAAEPRADAEPDPGADESDDGAGDQPALDPEAEALLKELMDDYELRQQTDAGAEDGPARKTDDDGATLADADAGADQPVPDGHTRLDDQFVIRGSGTQEDPYRITWELLMSAAETYSPRLGQMEMPRRIEHLHEQHVRITGYLAFPVTGQETDELLVMLNEWDGCCLGVPPSPYDAIEVRLSRPMMARGGIEIVLYGTVEGTLLVDPYLIDDWLLGLYLLEDATLRIDE